MVEFALLKNNVFQEFRVLPERPVDIAHKQITWFPVVREYGEVFEGVEEDAYVVRTIDPATLPPPVPFSISDRQFFQQLAVIGTITEAEAEAEVATGTLPPAMVDLIALLPEPAQFPARMLLKGATVFQRNHEMTDTIAWLYGWTSEDVDTLFREAVLL